MRQWTVGSGEQGRRFNRYLEKKLPEAPSSFLYKMLRKKNITLNGKKASGSELLRGGDLVTFFLSDETIRGFGGVLPEDAPKDEEVLREYINAYRQLKGRIGEDGILYEDANILAVKKPVGVLSQKAAEGDRSMNEWFVGYLFEKGELAEGSGNGFLSEYRPSIVNRLDRNTGGILLCAKTHKGAREMSGLLRDRSLRKYYQAAVAGTVACGGSVEGSLIKDRASNTVNFVRSAEELPGGSFTRTIYRPLISGLKYSLLELELITGKTHQIRSHLSSIGHPILGDPKYGNTALNAKIRAEYGLRGQMLWCCRIEFPEMSGEFADLSHRVIVCDPPKLYREICDRK